MVEFCKRLLHLHPHFHCTVIIPTVESHGNAQKTLLEALPTNSSIQYIFLPPPSLNDLASQETNPATLIQISMYRSLPNIYEELNKFVNETAPFGAVLVDALLDQVVEFVKDRNVLSFVYFPSTAMMLSLCLYSSELDKAISREFRDLAEPIKIPGCVPVHGSDLPDSLQDRTNQEYQIFLQAGQRFHLADGVLVNTFSELEPGPIRALRERPGPTVYPIGPITQNVESSTHECLKWLDTKPPNSVVYACFGSSGTLSHEQLDELAMGLELSGQNFLWVYKPPSKFGAVADVCVENKDPLHFLPRGFLERTQKQGLVVPFWAPQEISLSLSLTCFQVQVLSHVATGGFLCHCGWNSIVESVVNGVPLIAWPLFAEQKLNAALVSDGLQVALRPKYNDQGIVGRQEIAKLVKSLIEGEQSEAFRQRMNDLKLAASQALQEYGSSTKTFSEFALKCKSFMNK
ncbi:hydroquinone glucosyltransferase-like [Neltuma alba]|uniref:hydroquinone glucosyltransferase-like n=1 Tax=Neltuma alba TaxID=207710 RepID=UPI0010A4D04E|nr:hydroquinone glucosyltransferase-like [Prosopis alba]